MTLQFREGSDGPEIIRTYVTEDGGQGVHLIPLEALATRMAMLGYDTPAPALDAILQEIALASEGPDINVYGCVYNALAQEGDLTAAQEQARTALAAPLGPDAQEVTEFKDALCHHFTEGLQVVGEAFLQAHRPPDLPSTSAT